MREFNKNTPSKNARSTCLCAERNGHQSVSHTHTHTSHVYIKKKRPDTAVYSGPRENARPHINRDRRNMSPSESSPKSGRRTHQAALERIPGAPYRANAMRETRIENREPVKVWLDGVDEMLLLQPYSGLETSPVVQHVRLEDHSFAPGEATILPI